MEYKASGEVTKCYKICTCFELVEIDNGEECFVNRHDSSNVISMSVADDSNPHELFQTDEDHWNWDLYVQQCDRIKLTDDQRQRSKDSFRYLQKTLGTGFLRRAFNERHPIFTRYFCNAAPPARLSLIRFAESLHAFETAPKFNVIIKRIKRRLKRIEDFQDVTEAMAVVEVANRFLQAGFDVELEPAIQVKSRVSQSRTKNPDFKIVDRETGQNIIVEVSRMMASTNQRLISATFEKVRNLLVDWGMDSDPEAYKDILKPRQILPFAIIHRGIEQPELDEILKRLKALIGHVRATGEFGELIVQDTIEVGIASYDNHEIARKWARDKGMKENDFVQGANFSSDEVARTKVKIREKLKQLPVDTPGMIVIEAKENFLLFVYDIRWLALTFEEELTNHKNLLRTVIFHSFVDGSTEGVFANVGRHTFCHLVRPDRSTEESLTIRNAQCSFSIPGETLKKLDDIFIPS
jgi:hypothetical protein